MSASKSPLDSSIKRSSSRTRRPTSRPTTPLRPSSKSSFRESGRSNIGGMNGAPLETFEPAFGRVVGFNDFPEAPVSDSFRRIRQQREQQGRSTNTERFHGGDFDGETTFMTTDTSFIDNPPTSSKATPKFTPPVPPSRISGTSSRGGVSSSTGRGSTARGGYRSARGSGLARARGSSLK